MTYRRLITFTRNKYAVTLVVIMLIVGLAVSALTPAPADEAEGRRG